MQVELVPDRGKDAMRSAPPPLQWQLCLRTVRLFYDEELVNACLQPIPDHGINASRLFDRWFHSQIYAIEGASTFSMV